MKYTNYVDFAYHYSELHDYEVKTIATKRHKILVRWLRAKRKAKGLKQSDVAKRLRRDQSWVARLEGGRRPLHVIELLDIAKAIGFSASAMVRELEKLGENNAK